MQPRYIIAKLGLFFIFLIFTGLNYSCGDDNKDIVPYVPVNLVLDIQADLAQLGVSEAATIIPNDEGFGILRFSSPRYPEIRLGQQVIGNGLIIYRVELYEFYIFDRTCTYQARTEYCAVEMDDTGLIPGCPCCQSKFVLPLEGAVNEGPAALPLKMYKSYVNNFQLFISN